MLRVATTGNSYLNAKYCAYQFVKCMALSGELPSKNV
jgi:hypothetical protein